MLIRYPPQGNSHRNVFASFDEIPSIRPEFFLFLGLREVFAKGAVGRGE